jgi:hypothetical protein
VIGVEDERLGEEVAAAIVLVEGAESSAEDLQEYVKGELARYKYPRKVFFLDELPKGPTGKILKREIEVPGGRLTAEDPSGRHPAQGRGQPAGTRARTALRRSGSGGGSR